MRPQIKDIPRAANNGGLADLYPAALYGGEDHAQEMLPAASCSFSAGRGPLTCVLFGCSGLQSRMALGKRPGTSLQTDREFAPIRHAPPTLRAVLGSKCKAGHGLWKAQSCFMATQTSGCFMGRRTRSAALYKSGLPAHLLPACSADS